MLLQVVTKYFGRLESINISIGFRRLKLFMFSGGQKSKAGDSIMQTVRPSGGAPSCNRHEQSRFIGKKATYSSWSSFHLVPYCYMDQVESPYLPARNVFRSLVSSLFSAFIVLIRVAAPINIYGVWPLTVDSYHVGVCTSRLLDQSRTSIFVVYRK